MPTQPRMTVLVTGAAGFIGSHLVEALLGQSVAVIGLDNYSTGSPAHLATVQDHRAFQMRQGDIRDADAVADACEQVEIVFHLAAVTHVAESIQQPEKYHEINVTGTEHVMSSASAAKVRRVVFVSSGAVYGTPDTIPIPEDAALHPLSPYGASKMAGERVCQTVAAQGNLQVPQLRLFNVYGPRQSAANEAGVVSIFLHRARQGRPLVIYGDGHQTRDFIFVDDVIEALIRAATQKAIPSTPINVGTGIPVSIRELAEEIQRQVPACSKELRFDPPRTGDIYHSVADIGRMQHLLQFTPRHTLHEGIRKTCRFDTEAFE